MKSAAAASICAWLTLTVQRPMALGRLRLGFAQHLGREDRQQAAGLHFQSGNPAEFGGIHRRGSVDGSRPIVAADGKSPSAPTPHPLRAVAA
jgi:hypothetical protein